MKIGYQSQEMQFPPISQLAMVQHFHSLIFLVVIEFLDLETGAFVVAVARAPMQLAQDFA